MAQGRSGVNTGSPDKFVFDSGEVYLNIDITALETAGSDAITNATTSAIKLGATRGGNTLNPNRTLRAIETDGVLGTPRGFVRRETSNPTLTVNLLEMSVANLFRALAGAVSAAAGEFTKITGAEITDESYADNIALITTYSGNPDLEIVAVVRNVLVLEAPEFSFQHRNELVLPVTFTGHIDVASPASEVWAIYHPGESGS